MAKRLCDPGRTDGQHSGEAFLPLDEVITDRDATISAPELFATLGRRVRVLRRDLDQLIADPQAASRVHEPIALGEGGGEGEGCRDARQFWGGEKPSAARCSITVFITSGRLIRAQTGR
jgi:hypothetical protein